MYRIYLSPRVTLGRLPHYCDWHCRLEPRVLSLLGFYRVKVCFKDVYLRLLLNLWLESSVLRSFNRLLFFRPKVPPYDFARTHSLLWGLWLLRRWSKFGPSRTQFFLLVAMLLWSTLAIHAWRGTYLVVRWDRLEVTFYQLVSSPRERLWALTLFRDVSFFHFHRLHLFRGKYRFWNALRTTWKIKLPKIFNQPQVQVCFSTYPFRPSPTQTAFSLPLNRNRDRQFKVEHFVTSWSKFELVSFSNQLWLSSLL